MTTIKVKNMFNFFRKKLETEDSLNNDWEMAESPVVQYDDKREFDELVEDIMTKLDQIKTLVEEMKNEHNS